MVSPHSGPEYHSRHSVDDRDHLYDDHDVPNTDDDTDVDVLDVRSRTRCFGVGGQDVGFFEGRVEIFLIHSLRKGVGLVAVVNQFD